MSNNSYTPKPTDTSMVEWPKALDSLVELLARHVHEHWAFARMQEGWIYGVNHDGQARTHPSLVPYDDLSESEKDYDRRSALETLRLILALGFRIAPKEDAEGTR